MTPLLLLVDLQHDYLNAFGLEPAAGSVIDRAAALLAGCRAANVPIVHVWTTVSREADQRMPHWKRQGKWLCVEGTPGHAPPATLAPTTSEDVIHKRFFSAFSSGSLAAILGAHKADTIVIAGIHLHACIRRTVLDAYERGFEVWIAEDAVGSDDAVHAAISRRYLQSRAARFATVAALLEMLSGNADTSDLSSHSSGEDPANLVSGAVLCAQTAQPNWAAANFSERRGLLDRLAVKVEQKARDLAQQMAHEIGKPVFYGQLEVDRTAEMLRAIARQEGSVEETATVRRRPLGVTAVITPWNNPVLIPLGKIGAALFYGNSVVWKPAPAAFSIARVVIECLRSAGCADGLAKLVYGDEHAASALMSDPRVDAVTLTGGSLAGNCAQEICARRHIPFQAELGGNNAAIVWPDCNLKEAATRIAEGAFGQAGQRCTANRRAIVHHDCYEEFLELVTQAAAALPWGDPLDPATRIGPLLNSERRDRVAALIERTSRQVKRIIEPHHSFSPLGDLSPLTGAYYPPTIVCCDDADHEIVQEEAFGPVLVIQKAADWSSGIQLCNGVRQALVAALFSSSAEIQERFIAEVRAGVVKINQTTADVAPDLPFGGWKASGSGPPEHGIADREFYTRLQTVYHDAHSFS